MEDIKYEFIVSYKCKCNDLIHTRCSGVQDSSQFRSENLVSEECILCHSKIRILKIEKISIDKLKDKIISKQEI